MTLAGFIRRLVRCVSATINSASSSIVMPTATATAAGVKNLPARRMIFTAWRRLIERRPSVSAILIRMGATIRVIPLPIVAMAPPVNARKPGGVTGRAAIAI